MGIISFQRNVVDRILLIRGNVYSFLSGAFLSIAVNLYTGIFASEFLPTRWKQVLTAAILTALSSLLWIVLAWKLDEVQRLFANTKSGVVEQDEAWRLLVGHRRGRLMCLVLAATLAALAGLVVVSIDARTVALTASSSDENKNVDMKLVRPATTRAPHDEAP